MLQIHYSKNVDVYKTPVFQIENLQEQLRDKEKQMSSLRERVKSLQTDTSNTDTALTTLEDSLAEKVRITSRGRYNTPPDYRTKRWCASKWHRHGRNLESEHLCLVINISCSLYMLLGAVLMCTLLNRNVLLSV